MSYHAFIARIQTSPHPNADRLQIAHVSGYSCIIGLDHANGELGIVFPEGGQLDESFCAANNLFRDPNANKDGTKGFLDPNRRIRAIKLRSIESTALWLPISALHTWIASFVVPGTDPEVFQVQEGEKLSQVCGHNLCVKYFTPATHLRIRNRSPKTPEQIRLGKALRKHYETDQLRSSRIPPNATAIISEKVHGTSGRTGNVFVADEHGFCTRAWNYIVPKRFLANPGVYRVLTGTRNTIVDTSPEVTNRKHFRVAIHYFLAPLIEKGDTWYYEIVGYEDMGRSIMGRHKIEKLGDRQLESKLKNQVASDSIVYHYGCSPNGRLLYNTLLGKFNSRDEPPRYKIYVYGITGQNGRDLPWEVVYTKVQTAIQKVSLHHADFLKTVPVIHSTPTGRGNSSFRDLCAQLSRRPSQTGTLPFMEGVCVRFEEDSPGKLYTQVHRSLKFKSFIFCALEGIARNDVNFVDTEEVT